MDVGCDCIWVQAQPGSSREYPDGTQPWRGGGEDITGKEPVCVNKKEALRQQAKRKAEEEFRRQVNGKCAYYGMKKGELAAQIPMPASTFSEHMKEPSMFRVWQLTRIAEILGFGCEVIAPVLGLEVRV